MKNEKLESLGAVTHTHTHNYVYQTKNEGIKNSYTVEKSAVLFDVEEYKKERKHEHRLFSYVHFLCT